MKTQRNDQNKKRVIVLDTSAFLAGYDPFTFPEDQMTVPKVEDEIKRNSTILLRLTTAIENGKLKVKAPSEDNLKNARTLSSKIGDAFKLSETDIQLLALASELKTQGYSPQIVTDDYSIQNVAMQIGVEFLALATFGIKRLLEWVRYCPACYREYPDNKSTNECQVCGTQLKRKPKRLMKNLNKR